MNGTGGAVYYTIALPQSLLLGAGDYYVICGDTATATVANCDRRVPAASITRSPLVGTEVLAQLLSAPVPRCIPPQRP